MNVHFIAYNNGIIVNEKVLPSDKYFEGYTEEQYEADVFDEGIHFDRIFVSFEKG